MNSKINVPWAVFQLLLGVVMLGGTIAFVSNTAELRELDEDAVEMLAEVGDVLSVSRETYAEAIGNVANRTNALPGIVRTMDGVSDELGKWAGDCSAQEEKFRKWKERSVIPIKIPHVLDEKIEIKPLKEFYEDCEIRCSSTKKVLADGSMAVKEVSGLLHDESLVLEKYCTEDYPQTQQLLENAEQMLATTKAVLERRPLTHIRTFTAILGFCVSAMFLFNGVFVLAMGRKALPTASVENR